MTGRSETFAAELPDVFEEGGYQALFDGRTLDGWFAIPRVYGTVFPGGPPVADYFAEIGVSPPADPEKHPAAWRIDDGVLIGEQDAPGSGYGGYLVTEELFGDFDLAIEMRHDWPADTGIMLHRRRDSWEGFQVLVDHRPSGGIGGFFGNGLASFSALPFAIDAVQNEHGDPIGLRPDDPETSVELVTQQKIDRLDYAADVADFLEAWHWDDWNEMRIRCVGGALPTITTWVNGVKIAQLNTSTLEAPDYDSAAIARTLGDRGHIALEVHDNDEMFGEARWGRGAACRWRNIRIREYDQQAKGAE